MSAVSKKVIGEEHLQTRTHGIACGDIVTEEVEKKQYCKRRRHKRLEMFRGDNATCNGCLAHREKRAENNTDSEGVMANVSCGK